MSLETSKRNSFQFSHNAAQIHHYRSFNAKHIQSETLNDSSIHVVAMQLHDLFHRSKDLMVLLSLGHWKYSSDFYANVLRSETSRVIMVGIGKMGESNRMSSTMKGNLRLYYVE
jgi:hypothetical protein